MPFSILTNEYLNVFEHRLYITTDVQLLQTILFKIMHRIESNRIGSYVLCDMYLIAKGCVVLALNTLVYNNKFNQIHAPAYI